VPLRLPFSPLLHCSISNQGIGADLVFVMLMIVALIAGLFQITFGVIGLGKLIKYMPFPVVSGYLSGVGLYIIASQAPIFLGLPQGTHFWDSFYITSCLAMAEYCGRFGNHWDDALCQ
jgi:sulfate permease, SulP family